jgi:hypothetical protein
MKIPPVSETSFTAEHERVDSFIWNTVINVLINSSYINVPLLLWAASRGEKGWPIVGVAATALFVAVVSALLGTTRFQHIRINLGPLSIQRDGNNFQRTQILYSDIGRVIEKRHGFVIIKKGISANLEYYLLSRVLIASELVIFVPSLIENYQAIKEFFVSMQYEMVQPNNNMHT